MWFHISNGINLIDPYYLLLNVKDSGEITKALGRKLDYIDFIGFTQNNFKKGLPHHIFSLFSTLQLQQCLSVSMMIPKAIFHT